MTWHVRMLTVSMLLAALAVPLGLANPPAASAAGTITVGTKERGSEGPALYACYSVEDLTDAGTGNGGVGAACDGDDGAVDGTTRVRVADCSPCRVSQSLREKPNNQPNDYLLEPSQTGAEGQTFVFRNFLRPYLVVTAVDAQSGKPLEGACIAVEDRDRGGTSFGGCDGNAASGLGDQDGQRDGRITTRRLNTGTYRVHQKSPAPAGYLLGAAVDVTADPAQTGEFEAVTAEFPQAPKIAIKTVDAKTGKRLKGACYGIADTSHGGGVGTFCDGQSTDQDGASNGVVVTKALPAGHTYAINQTKAPRGYRLVGPDKTTTTAAGTTSAVTFKNRPKG